MIMVFVAYGYMVAMALVLLYCGTGLSESVKGVIYRKRNHAVSINVLCLPENNCWFKPPDVWEHLRASFSEVKIPVYFKNENTKAMWLLRNK